MARQLVRWLPTRLGFDCRERRCCSCELTCCGHPAREQARRLFYFSERKLWRGVACNAQELQAAPIQGAAKAGAFAYEGITRPGGRDSPKILARSTWATGTNVRSLASLDGATPQFCSFDAIFSRRRPGKSTFGLSK